MEKQNLKNTEVNLIYGVDDDLDLPKKVLFGLQHIFAAFGGIIVVPLVIATSLGFDSKVTTALISASILGSGLATIIQAKGVGKVGARVACIMGTDFTFVSPAISVGSVLGLPGIIGATILGSLFEVILSFFIKPLMKFFPPLVTGTVVALIGLTLLPVSIDWAAGGAGSANYASLENLAVAMFVLVITLLLNNYGKGMISSASILIGIVVGYLVCIPLGLVDFNPVKEASWLSFPKILEFGVTFDAKAVMAFIPAYFVATIGTVGCLKAIGETSNIDIGDKRVAAGVLSDGVGSALGGLVGSCPNTSFSQNIGIISLTKVASRHVAVMAGILLVILGFLPKVAAIITGIPNPVLGGVGIMMFGTVAAAGIRTLSNIKLTERNLLIIAISMGLGLGVTFRPDVIHNLPEAIRMIFSSGISTGTIAALILNAVLKESPTSMEFENMYDEETKAS
ncbi:uracil-xanthine permease family protein [Clostridium perfringens]|uniref:uracil-xanthine permease family protein n=1 Tax=Clostridium perfringens TaxID=1502 RepID=UPI001A1A7837|nr:nucleobase:cation symporter-2 family protein [Clostridium perfringens]ELC8383265.1 purine permease [Clostridium perfringens]MDM0937364.1 nucleobase:cation symporter-2 family protein [Clostridium perfringens]MDT7913870.1 nucleobase:cation symporter-2 family protein [Clostridium perfringens]MDT7926893.1 nucleobase:cation symporter-2 family protein [Clostridium perfringens]MDT7959415.1 nucleobase:cation symporter-2 family protein [Clostridium perfringens]